MTGLKSAGSAQNLSTQLSRSLRYAALKSKRAWKRKSQILPTYSSHNFQFDHQPRLAKMGVSLAIGSAAVLATVSSPNHPLAPEDSTSSLNQELPSPPDYSDLKAGGNHPAVEVSAVFSNGTIRNQVRVNDTAVISLGAEERDRALVIAQRLQDLADLAQLSPDKARPDKVNDLPVGSIDDEVVFTVDRQTADWYGRTPEDLTVMWVNNLRIALKGNPLSSREAANYKYRFNPKPIDFEGLASWYGPYFYGRPTASGELFVRGTMTAAHKTLPLGTYLEVTSPDTGRTIVVRVNDRGPYIGPRVLDLSETAARELGVLEMGVSNVQVRIIDAPSS